MPWRRRPRYQEARRPSRFPMHLDQRISIFLLGYVPNSGAGLNWWSKDLCFLPECLALGPKTVYPCLQLREA